jgi:hypothetical protein
LTLLSELLLLLLYGLKRKVLLQYLNRKSQILLMLNAKKVFRHDSATGKLISADAVQLKGDYSVIYDAKEILKSDSCLFFDRPSSII